MFKLNDPLNYSLTLNDVEYELDMSFDNVIDAIEILNGKEMTVVDKLDTFVFLFNPDLDKFDLETKQYIIEQIMGFINTEPIEKQELDIEGNPMPTTKGDEHKELISFSYDAKYIYAAFLQAYGIDLIEQQGKLHWVKFSALINALPDDTLMRQIIDIRGTDVSKIKDKEEKKRIKELQKIYRLPNQIEEEGGDDYG